MNRKILMNDFAKNKLACLSLACFFTVSCVLFAVTLCLAVQLTGSISALMTVAKTPNYLQMHAGEIDEKSIAQFADAHDEVEDFQVCKFLNIPSDEIYLADCSLSGSTQDNGVCVQPKRFDFLLNLNNEKPKLKPGEIGVPVCYMRQYGLNLGDSVSIGNREFEIVCFIRDSQMNSMLASSKRFLVCLEDYQALLELGEEEYLIEFLLSENANTSVFAAEYSKAGLPQNGPAITKSMVLMVNVISDGIMIAVILFVSTLVLLVSLLCIRFIVLTKLAQDKKEIGMLKALGVHRKKIRKMYFSKYVVIAFVSSVVAVCIALVLASPLSKQMRELYGDAKNGASLISMAMLGSALVSGIMLLTIWKMLKRTEKMSALQALFDISENQKKKRAIKWYLPVALIVAVGSMLMVVPLNIQSTISSPVFVTYLGIGNSEVRIDVRQSEDIAHDSIALAKRLENDGRVSSFVRLDTLATKMLTRNNEEINLFAEYGDHSIFPVSYSAGNAPKANNEIALSLLNAKELRLSVGDEVRIIQNGETVLYTVCGIYSDITNGGKTAKIYEPALSSGGSERVMWSIFYVSLVAGENRENWIAEYKTLGEKTFRVSDIASYIMSTFGQTITQSQLAANLSVISSSIILFVVLLLFSRLYVQSDRKDISLKKALGFRWKAVAKAYINKYAISVVVGIIVGEALGFLLGESLTGVLLKNLGADGFKFIPNLPRVIIMVPVLVFVVCIVAVCCGIYETKWIKPAECVTGRE